MAFQRVPDTAQIEFKYLITGVPIVNTLYAQKLGGYDAASLDALADACDLWAPTGIIANLSSDTLYVEVTCRGLDNEFDIVTTRTDSPGTAGGIVSAAAPLNVAFCVKFTAGLTGRSTRGRNYIGGLAETTLGIRSINTAVADAFVAAYEQLRLDIIAAGWTQVIVSRYANGAKRPEAVVFPVTDVSYTDITIDTRRSRLNNE